MRGAADDPESQWPLREASATPVEERSQPVVHSDPEIMGGTTVFFGTRVPLDAMFDYLEGDHPPDEFLDNFPTVSRAQALAALEIAREALLSVSARPHR